MSVEDPGSFRSRYEDINARVVSHALNRELFATFIVFSVAAGAFVVPLVGVLTPYVAVALWAPITLHNLVHIIGMSCFIATGKMALIGVAVAAVGAITLLAMMAYHRLHYGKLPDGAYDRVAAGWCAYIAKNVEEGASLRQHCGDGNYKRIVALYGELYWRSKASLVAAVAECEKKLEELNHQVDEEQRLLRLVLESTAQSDCTARSIRFHKENIAALNAAIAKCTEELGILRSRLHGTEGIIWLSPFGKSSFDALADLNANARDLALTLFIVCSCGDAETSKFSLRVLEYMGLSPAKARGMKMLPDYKLLEQTHS
ncbi:MAG: hypothetical protein LBB38_01320 [Puniceicoccales bacterium]|jgi:hypothetical protein|nr:hypothetical protein [Puniceicoccales bacterium]